MIVIIIKKSDLTAYLERYFDDADNDGYVSLIKNYYSKILEGYLHYAIRKNGKRFV
jgi:hypothetical protein